MIAPSFEKYEVVNPEPFLKGGRLYITVKHPNTGNKRDIRWYDEKEYARVFPTAKKQQESKNKYGGLRTARGFSDGPVMVIRGAVAANEQWLSASIARYATDIGWYIASTDKLPENVPSTLKGILLSWDEMKGQDDESVRAPAALKEIIADKIKNNRDIVRFNMT